MNTRPAVWAWARLGLLVAALTTVATPAWSKVYVLDRGDNVLVRVFYRFYGPPDSGPQQVFRTIADPDTCATFQLKNPSPDCQSSPNSNCFYHHITASGCVDRTTDPSTVSSYALIDGNATAGPHGLGTSGVIADTSYAEGFVSVGVRRLGLLLTLTNLAVQLRNNSGSIGNPGGLPAPTRNRLIVAVYPDTTTALADMADLRGTGSRFFGKLELLSGVNTLRATAPVAGVPGFSAGDFALSILPGGILQAAPVDTFLRIVYVPNASNAAVVVANDPASGADATLPATTPIGILSIGLAMLGGGAWYVRARRSASIGEA